MKAGHWNSDETSRGAHYATEFREPELDGSGAQGAVRGPREHDSISALLNRLPEDCLAVAADVRYWNSWRSTEASGGQPIVEYLNSTPLGKLLGQPGGHLQALTEVLHTHGGRHVVAVRVNKEGALALAKALISWSVPLVEGAGGTAAWSEPDIVKSALEHDMASIGRGLLADSEDAVRAIAGGVSVAGRDILTRTVTATRFEQQDILVLQGQHFTDIAGQGRRLGLAPCE